MLSRFFAEKKAESKKDNLQLEDMYDHLQTFCIRGGKRIRPLLVKTVHQLFSPYDEGDVLPIMCAVEMLHQYLMMLDDVADRDEYRHHAPTLEMTYRMQFQHEKDALHLGRTFSEISSAIQNTCISDLLFSSTAPLEQKKNILLYMNTVMYRNTVAGWKLHFLQNLVPIDQASQEEYMRGLFLVSAQYTFVGPMHIGTMIRESKDSIRSRPILQTYGTEVGVAFQLEDDILGVFGETEKTGKPVGNDIREGKKTILIQEAYARASLKEKQIIRRCIGSPLTSEDLEQIQTIIKNTGALQQSQERIRISTQRGIDALQALPDSANTTSIQYLIDLAKKLQNREV
ncbi:MAG: Geranylgeranyl pyrophosphate synthase [Microgenomates group bacterium GW2011_GWF1_44_10]|nr:MAG: Geranylgeranyl pyrophosphate synthase [Microgenomates group bacterium GW2011_GWF1_44_10]